MAFCAIDSGEIPISPLPAEPLTGVGPIGPQGVQGTPGPYRNPTDAVYVQPVWAIDSVNGNDANSGTPAAPLKTAGKYFALTGGLYRPVSGPVQIQLINDLPATDPLVLSNMYLTPTAQLKVIDGNPTVLASGQLTGQVSFNSKTSPSGQLQVVTDSGRTTWSPLIGKIFKVTSGAAAGATAVVIADLGGGSAEVSIIGRAVPTALTSFQAVAIVGNETYQVLERRGIGALIVSDADPNAYMWTQFPQVISLLLVGMKFPQVGNPAGFYLDRGAMVTYDCDHTNTATLVGARLIMNNGYSSGGSFGISGNVTPFYGYFKNTSIVMVAPALFDMTSPIFDTCSLTMQEGHCTFEIHHEIGVYNSASFLAAADGALIKIRHGIFGSGNTGSLIQIHSGGRVLTEAVVGTSDFPVTGTGVGYQDIKFGTQTQLPAIDSSNNYVPTALRALTFANYFQSVVNGGFGQSIFDPAAPMNAMQTTGQ